MQKLIKDGAIIENTWQFMGKPEASPADAEIPSGPVMLPFSVWAAQREILGGRSDIGVWLDSDETADLIGDLCNDFPVIGVNFPGFMDGRAFSTARLLRERYNYQGELRATGHFIRDQLCYLRRCGVNAFAFANPAVDLTLALKSLNDFSAYYQASVDQPLPLFRRRV